MSYGYWLMVAIAFMLGFVIRLASAKYVNNNTSLTGPSISGLLMASTLTFLGLLLVDIPTHLIFPDLTVGKCALYPYLCGWLTALAFIPTKKPLPSFLRVFYVLAGVSGMIYLVFFQ